MKAGERGSMEKSILAEIDSVIHEQEAAPPLALETMVQDVYAAVPAHSGFSNNSAAALLSPCCRAR